DILLSTAQQDILIGYAGADRFTVGGQGVHDIAYADIIVDFDAVSGDRIQLQPDVALSNLVLDAVDLNTDGIADSTAILRQTTREILAVVQNTVDAAGNTLLSLDQFI
ncbi:MAG: hypothetical protein F6J97_15035, partial [Leptolyngbya sp. SIO4C1]|nr:hypothetical protein [Leptolyngbya sp. SIO4C1]